MAVDYTIPKDEYRALLAENAKLRELVSIMAFCMQDDSDCDRCKMNGASGGFKLDPLFACEGLYDRLRELGVGVTT